MNKPSSINDLIYENALEKLEMLRSSNNQHPTTTNIKAEIEKEQRMIDEKFDMQISNLSRQVDDLIAREDARNATTEQTQGECNNE